MSSAAGRFAFSYLAFSTPQQGKGRSSDRQHVAAQKWCDEHGIPLAPSRQYCDEGVSRFNGRARMKGALSRFLKLCGTSAVPPGSILIVEDFDRLSRENPDDAWELFRRILLAEVEIVVLSLGRWFTRESLNRFEDRLLVQSCQFRAHQESAMKADRQRDIWADRRRRAASGKGIHTNLPSWVMRQEDGSLALIPEREETIRLMVKWSLEGMGCRRISRRLGAGPDSRPCWFQAGQWDWESVQQVLKSPALWGAYKPTKMRQDRRLAPTGEVIKGHYPAILTELEALQVQRAMTKRKRERGRPSKQNRNVLRHVAKCAETGGNLRVKANSNEGKSQWLDRRYKGRTQTVIAYDTLEEIVLRSIQEWSPDALADGVGDVDAEGKGGRTGELQRRLASIESDRESIRLEIQKPGRAGSTIAILAGQLDALDAEERDLQGEIADRLTGRPVAAALSECQSIIKQLAGLEDAELEGARQRLNEHLRELLQGVWVYRKRWTVQTGEVIVQVWPRCGEPKTTLVLLGIPPAGYIPTDVTGLDLRQGYPERLAEETRKPSGRKNVRA